MNTNFFNAFICVSMACALGAGCGNDHDHDHGGHDHDHGDHDHDHGGHEAHAGHDHGSVASLWGWSPNMEAYVEISGTAPGATADWWVHLTNPATGEPIEDAVLLLTTGAGGEMGLLKPKHSEKGLYTTRSTLPAEGEYAASLAWSSGERQGQLNLGTLAIHDHPMEEESPSAIAVTKEQVWQIPFQVQAVRRDTIREVLRAGGRWLAAPGDEWLVHAPGAGAVMHARTGLVPGAAVAEGEVLFLLAAGEVKTGGLSAERVAAMAEFEAAHAARERIRVLRSAGAATLGEWDEAQRRWQVAKEAKERWAEVAPGDVTAVRAERSGVIRSVAVTPGTYVRPGATLARLASAKQALLEVAVSPEWAPVLEHWQAVKVQTQASSPWQSCEVISVDRAVQEDDGMLPIFIGCPTDAGIPIPGTFADVVMEHGEGEVGWVVPESALLEHYGSFEVAVQTGGEQYTLLPVEVGRRGAGEVEVLKGLQAGDRVVTQGAYTVRMASMKSSTPAHGHTH